MQSSKKELYLLLASFILPILFGTLFFYLNPGYFTKSLVNYGQLIQPIITTNKNDIILKEKKSMAGIWSLAYVVQDNCNNSCQQAIDNMQKIRLLLNDNMRRVQVITLSNNSKDNNIKNKKTLFAKTSSKLLDKLSHFPANTIFLIDPIGNFMMYYNADNLVIKRVLKDFSRLLKYSRIG